MGLKTDLKIGEVVRLGKTTIEVIKNQRGMVTIDINAPKNIKIELEKGLPGEKEVLPGKDGQQMTPEEQQKEALKTFNRRNYEFKKAHRTKKSHLLRGIKK